MNVQKAIELCNTFNDDLRKCEKCKSIFDLDNIFLDIYEICDGTDESIEKYEKKYNVDLSNYWCQNCADKALKEIEREVA
jgi:glycyl-tRNA synthetase (class II)